MRAKLSHPPHFLLSFFRLIIYTFSVINALRFGDNAGNGCTRIIVSLPRNVAKEPCTQALKDISLKLVEFECVSGCLCTQIKYEDGDNRSIGEPSTYPKWLWGPCRTVEFEAWKALKNSFPCPCSTSREPGIFWVTKLLLQLRVVILDSAFAV